MTSTDRNYELTCDALMSTSISLYYIVNVHYQLLCYNFVHLTGRGISVVSCWPSLNILPHLVTVSFDIYMCHRTQSAFCDDSAFIGLHPSSVKNLITAHRFVSDAVAFTPTEVHKISLLYLFHEKHWNLYACDFSIGTRLTYYII